MVVVVVYRRCAEEFGGWLVVGDGVYAIRLWARGPINEYFISEFLIYGVKE